ncbi:MAG: hypothetical protein KDD62_11945 [Bdellovibrionales bacterium]|nr:hypothetical protein [Bdellovibrionales bacterium]
MEVALKILANHGVLMQGGAYRFLPLDPDKSFLGVHGITHYGYVLLHTNEALSKQENIQYYTESLNGYRPDSKRRLLETGHFRLSVLDDLSNDIPNRPWLRASISSKEILETLDHACMTPRIKADLPIRIIDILRELSKPGAILSKELNYSPFLEWAN